MMQNRKVVVMVVSIAACSLSEFFAPKNLEITTPAPIEKPLKKNTSMLTIMDVEPTAANASFPT